MKKTSFFNAGDTTRQISPTCGLIVQHYHWSYFIAWPRKHGASCCNLILMPAVTWDLGVVTTPPIDISLLCVQNNEAENVFQNFCIKKFGSEQPRGIRWRSKCVVKHRVFWVLNNTVFHPSKTCRHHLLCYIDQQHFCITLRAKTVLDY